MAEVWDLPDDSMLQPTGREWLIGLMHALTENHAHPLKVPVDFGKLSKYFTND
jgi:hypothetical protein